VTDGGERVPRDSPDEDDVLDGVLARLTTRRQENERSFTRVTHGHSGSYLEPPFRPDHASQ